MIDRMNIPLTDRVLDDIGEKIGLLDCGSWRITIRKHAITKGTNIRGLPYAYHDIDDRVIERGGGVVIAVHLAMGPCVRRNSIPSIIGRCPCRERVHPWTDVDRAKCVFP